MAKTLEQGFEMILNRLVPLDSEHKKATSHKQSVKSCLEKNFGCYSFFETGSFGHGTGVRHYSDTDYFAVCQSEDLKSNPSLALREVKEALQSTFWRTEGIEVKTPAIRIPFGSFKSENLEVTPCVWRGLLETPFGKKRTYTIAAYDGTWMRSSPDAHNAYVNKQDKRLSGKLKPLIRLVKAWKFYNNVPLRSFYLELRVTKYAEGKSSIVYDTDLRRIMKTLADNELASIRDPMGISGLIDASNTAVKKQAALSKLSMGLSRAEKAVEQTEKNLDKCFYWWNRFFNGKFPAR